jgi:4-aminobutyrate aminotransferase
LTLPSLVTEIPGPNARSVIEADEAVTSPSLSRAYPLVPARGVGSAIEDVDGNVFLDFNAGIAVCATGHCHPAVVEAITRQASELLHFSASDFYLPIYGQLCQRLAEGAPFAGDARVFLTNSGTEAVEGALKLSRYYTRRDNVIAFFGGFHGRSYGGVSTSASRAKYRSPFGPLLPGIIHAPYADLFSLQHRDQPEAAVEDYIESVIFRRLVNPEDVAAIMVEPILGEGGYIVPPAAWIRQLREICDNHGILLIADEVQCGVGRTGKMWAIEHFGVEPDILVAAKGIASGMPLGAVISRADVTTWAFGAHGSTFGGNPVACAAALATIDLVEAELMANASQVGELLIDHLRTLGSRVPQIRDVRGLGLMIGVEFETPALADAVELACFHRGLLVLRAGDATVRISPPLILTEEQALVGVQLFAEACDSVLDPGNTRP